jgi:hypothetical protein
MEIGVKLFDFSWEVLKNVLILQKGTAAAV